MQRKDCEILFGFEAWEARNAWRGRRRGEVEAEAAEAAEAMVDAEVDTVEVVEVVEAAEAAASATANMCQAKNEQAQRVSRKRSREEPEGDGDQRSEQETRRAVKRRKEVAFVEGRFHCEVDCEYPTQCSHTVYRAFKRGRAEYAEVGGGYVYVGEREL